MEKQILVALVASTFALLSGSLAHAQQPLTGGVQMNDSPSTSVRIQRRPVTPAPLSSGLQSSDFASAPKYVSQAPQSAPLVDSKTFKGALNEIKKMAPLFASAGTGTISGGVDWSIPANPNAPYVWNQSALGGYWDSSGTSKTTVWGDKLYQLGGKFADGTPVPKAPIRDINAMGHCYRQPKLPTQAFWSH